MPRHPTIGFMARQTRLDRRFRVRFRTNPGWAAPTLSQMRLLVVEDELDLAEAVARGLRRRGHAVDVAATVLDAELRLSGGAYDLVLLDWNLPDGTGLELCTR